MNSQHAQAAATADVCKAESHTQMLAQLLGGLRNRTGRQQPLLTKGQGHSQLLQRLPNAPVDVLPGQPACLAQRHLFQQGEHSGHWVLPLSPCLPTSSCCCGCCCCAWAGDVRAEQRHKQLRKHTIHTTRAPHASGC